MGAAAAGNIRKALCRQRSLRGKGKHELIGMILLKQGAIDNSQLISILRHMQTLQPDRPDIIDFVPGVPRAYPHPAP